MNALQRWRPLFLARSRREKLLAALFVVVLAAIWAGSIWGRFGGFSERLTAARERSTRQGDVLRARANIEQNYQAALASLNTDLPPGAQVYARLEELARKHFSPNFPRMQPPQRDSKEQLTFNTISISPSRAGWAQLFAFYQEVSQQLPTVKLAEVSLNTERPAPGVDQISARFKFVAIEINR